MEVHASLARRLRYEGWAQATLLGHLEAATNAPDAAWRVLDHVVGTGENWLARLEGRAPELAIWPALAPAERGRWTGELARRWERFHAAVGPDGWLETATYRNSSGVEYTTTRLDVLQHVLLHAHYHRGQVALLLRQAGIDPPWVDPIAWTRLPPGTPGGPA